METDMYLEVCRISDHKRESMRAKMVSMKVERDRALEELARVIAERDEAVAFAERIEGAAKGREELDVFGVPYVALPVDSDGVTIRVNDMMMDGGTAFKVWGYTVLDGRLVPIDLGYGTHSPESLRRWVPESWVRVFSDIMDIGKHGGVLDMKEAIRRCKRLAKEDNDD